MVCTTHSVYTPRLPHKHTHTHERKGVREAEARAEVCVCTRDSSTTERTQMRYHKSVTDPLNSKRTAHENIPSAASKPVGTVVRIYAANVCIIQLCVCVFRIGQGDEDK